MNTNSNLKFEVHKSKLRSTTLIISHHVQRRNNEITERMANLLISSNVHYTHFGGENKTIFNCTKKNILTCSSAS